MALILFLLMKLSPETLPKGMSFKSKTARGDIRYYNGAMGHGAGYGTTEPASISLERGRGVWLVSHGGASAVNPVIVQLKGGVNLSESLTTTFGERYVIAATGLPVDAPANGDLFNWQNLNEKDQLQVPRQDGSYTVLEWNASTRKWCPFGNPTEEAFLLIPKESAIWIVSSNPNAHVIVSPEAL